MNKTVSLGIARYRSLRGKEALFGYLTAAPAVLGLLIFIVYPIGASIYYSLTDFSLVVAPHWVGLGNYVDLVGDPLFWQSLKVTVLFALMSMPISFVFSLALAVLMNQKVPLIAFWRTVYYLPAVISGVAVAILWSWIYNPEFGLANTVLKYLGVKGPNWLADVRTALPALVVISLWGVGGSMVIYLSGLQSIPTELYEAAEIDGAGGWRKFVNITIPMLS